MSTCYARVALNVRVRSLFDYRLPPNEDPRDAVGRRVRVPLQKREVIGIVMAITDTPSVSADKIKPLAHIYRDMPPLPPATLALINFCAEYYHCPIGIATAAALPTFFRRANRYHLPTGYRLTAGADSAAAPLRGKAADIITLLQDGEKTAADIRRQISNPYSALKKLLTLQRIERCVLSDSMSPPVTDTDTDEDSTTAPSLSAAQKKAIATLNTDNGFIPHLLFGATGSGKSEIYLHAAAALLAQKKQILILLPEIHLTPQMEQTVQRRFPQHRIALLHSGLSDGERARRWLQARLGNADIVLGTRLAVFTPLPALGLIVIDEEHDDSFKQEEGGLLFSARNVAIWRAKNENIPLIAGSATPALETLHNARQPPWKLLSLPQRVSTSPRITILGESSDLYHGMESAFIRRLTQKLNDGKQCLLFINRRGYAPALLCRDCNQPQRCTRCSHNMTVHRNRDILLCHLCGSYRQIPLACPHCGGNLTGAGSGTQRIETALARLFPAIPAVRIDRDAAGSDKSFAARYAAIASGETPLIIGTQMLAKGHNFPHLAFIGILNSDSALAAADIRAEERLFALLAQVIGRGTRNPAGCEVLIQTRYPTHPFYRELANDDVAACWERLLRERQQSAMPPFAHLAVLRGKNKNLPQLENFMRQAERHAKAIAPRSGVQIFDAVAPTPEKISGWHRRQILFSARQRPPLRRFLHRLTDTLPPGANWLIDVDPLTI